MAKKSLLLFGSICFSSVAWTQAMPPDAGVLMQQVPKFDSVHRPGVLPASEGATPAAAATTGPKVQVQRVRLQGNTLLSSEQLAPSLAPYLQQSLSLAQLEQAAQAVEARQVSVRSRGETPCGGNSTGRVPAFQAGYAGSIPVTRSPSAPSRCPLRALGAPGIGSGGRSHGPLNV